MLSRLALATLFLLSAAAAASARSPAPAGEPRGVILGDSLGMGVAYAAGLKVLAKPSVHIRGPKILEQIASVPAGGTAFLVIGNNDAASEIKFLEPGIDAIIQAAEAKNIRLVWVGAPCVRRSWNAKSAALDEMLRKRFANTAITYVSMHDVTICSGQFFGPDGVHMNMKGYTYMWEKMRRAAGWSSPNESIAGSSPAHEPAAVATNKSAEPAEAAPAAPKSATAATPPAPTTPAPTVATEKPTPPTAAASAHAPNAGKKNAAPRTHVVHRERAPRPRAGERESAPHKRAPTPAVATYVTDERFRN